MKNFIFCAYALIFLSFFSCNKDSINTPYVAPSDNSKPFIPQKGFSWKIGDTTYNQYSCNDGYNWKGFADPFVDAAAMDSFSATSNGVGFNSLQIYFGGPFPKSDGVYKIVTYKPFINPNLGEAYLFVRTSTFFPNSSTTKSEEIYFSTGSDAVPVNATVTIDKGKFKVSIPECWIKKAEVDTCLGAFYCKFKFKKDSVRFSGTVRQD